MFKIIIFLVFIFSTSLFSMAENLEFKHPSNLSKFNGNVAEDFMSKYFKGSGWKQLPGEVGSNGIDGLFVKTKNGVVSDVMFVESKFKSKGISIIKGTEMSLSRSGIGKTKDGALQMSQHWSLKKVDTLIEKGEARYKGYYKQIRRHVQNGTVKKRYFGMTKLADGKIKVILEHIEDVGAKGIKIVRGQGNKSKLTSFIFDPKSPKTAFEKKIATYYKDSMKAQRKLFVANEKAIKIAKSSRKGFTKIVASVSKSGWKSAAKIGSMGLLSAASAIPILGVAAQVAADIYMQYQIQELEKATQENKAYIQRVDAEVKILGKQVIRNRQDIEKLFQNIFNMNAELSSLSATLAEVKIVSDKNAKEIQNIKDGILLTGFDELEAYYNSAKKDRDSLMNAINNFKVIIKINKLNQDINSLALNALNIACIEKAYIYKYENKDNSFLLKEIVVNYKEVINNKNLPIILNAFHSMQDIFHDSPENLAVIREELFLFLETKTNESLAKNRFEDAISFAKIVQVELLDSSLFEKANKQREENFHKYAQALNRLVEIENILSQNQNILLNRKAIRIAYREDNYNLMLSLLNKYPLDDDEFKIKAFYLAYKIIDKKKANELKKLVLENSTYSLELKKYIQK